VATLARHEILVFRFGEAPQKIRVYGGVPPPPPGSREVIQTELRDVECDSHSGEGGVGGLPSPGPYLLRRFSKPNTIISWRARVAPGNAIKGGPGREAPQPRPRIYRFASKIPALARVSTASRRRHPVRVPTASRRTSSPRDHGDAARSPGSAWPRTPLDRCAPGPRRGASSADHHQCSAPAPSAPPPQSGRSPG
jgi:hypothetical protein